MRQNCKRLKAVFRFLLRLITLFIWKGKRPCDKPCCSKVNEVPKASTELLPRSTKLVVMPESPSRKKYVKTEKGLVVVGFKTKKGKTVKVKATKGKKVTVKKQKKRRRRKKNAV